MLPPVFNDRYIGWAAPGDVSGFDILRSDEQVWVFIIEHFPVVEF
jgi:hypothetical protein